MTEPYALGSHSPRHGLPYLHPGQAQKEAFVNEALARLDALVHATVNDQRAVPPADPEPGAAYLVAAGASGDWQGEEDSLAVFQGTHWLFQPPVRGASVRRLDSGQIWIFDDGWSAAVEPNEPSGGVTIDSEARAAIAALVSALRHSGIFPSM